jgi:hypothetical protein
MQQALRPYVTAGVAVLGAGMIAVTPMTAASVVSQAPALRLTAGEGFFDTWQSVFDTASANAVQVANNFLIAPEVGLQQFIVNQETLWGDVANGTTTFQDALTQMQDTLQMLGSALTLDVDTADDAGKAIWDAVTPHTLDGLRGLIITMLPGMLPADSEIDPEQVTGILQFLSSPLSAMLIGSLSPGISPLVALGNSITEISDALNGDTPDFEAAFNGLLNIPANMVNGFLNGADLNLDALLPAINDAGFLPEGMELTALDFAFGGLLSPGVAGGAGDQGTYTFDDGTTVDPVGGSIFNNLGLTLTGVPIIGELNLESVPIGPIAAMEQWSQVMGVLLGDEWDGKDAVQTPPLFGLDPIVTDDAGAGFASLFGDLLSDV